MYGLKIDLYFVNINNNNYDQQRQIQKMFLTKRSVKTIDNSWTIRTQITKDVESNQYNQSMAK